MHSIRKLLLLIFVACFIPILGACTDSSSKLAPDRYIEGYDTQYFQLSMINKEAKLQNSSVGCILYHDRFLYQFDQKNHIIMPLCSQPNCLHDQETDPEKLEQCRAYLGEAMNEAYLSVQLYNKNVYVFFEKAIDSGRYACLYRVSEDGSNKELIFKQLDMSVDLPIIHRGYLYFHGQSYSVDSSGISSGSGIFRVNVNDRTAKLESVKQSEANTGYGFMNAYGKYVYFDEGNLFAYNTEDGSITDCGENYGNYAFFNGKLLYQTYNADEGSSFISPVIRAELDNSNPEEMLTDIPQGYYVSADQKYIYLNNAPMVTWGAETTKQFWVYDENWKLIDEFIVPETDNSYLDPPIGGSDYQYEIFDDPDTGEWGLLVWDKSKIGSYNGAAFEQQRIVYGAK